MSDNEKEVVDDPQEEQEAQEEPENQEDAGEENPEAEENGENNNPEGEQENKEEEEPKDPEDPENPEDPDNPDKEDGEEPKIVEEPEPEVELPTIDLVEEKKRSHRIIKEGLSKLAKIPDNTGYAFIDLNVEGKELMVLSDILSFYVNLRYANFSNNKIKDITSIEHCAYLLTLNASKNLIEDMRIFTLDRRLTFLTEMNLSGNKITKLPAITLPCLEKLYLNENEIESCEEFRGHLCLRVLELRKNKLKNCRGLRNCRVLTDLDLSQNQISDISHLENLPELKNLNLMGNKIEVLKSPLPQLPKLSLLNLDENIIADVKTFYNLREIPSLKTLLCNNNPFLEELGNGLKKELIRQFLPDPTVEDLKDLNEEVKMPTPPMIPDLTLINEDEVVQEDKDDVWQEKKEEEQKRIEEEEERRREEEERKREEEERLRREEEERLAEEERLRAEEEERKRAELEKSREEAAAKEKEKEQEEEEEEENAE